MSLLDFYAFRLQEARDAVRARAEAFAQKLNVTPEALLSPRARHPDIRLGRAALVYVCHNVDGVHFNDLAHTLGVSYGTVLNLHKLGGAVVRGEASP